MPAPRRVLFSRGGLRESEHRLVWVVTRPDGKVLAESEPDDAGLGVFPRSALKPLQALPSVRAGTLEYFGLASRHLALGCSSHGGDRRHVEVVAELLAAAGRTEGDLLCGPLDPRDPVAAEALRRGGSMPARITHNCSGKHALALARCRLEGWGIGNYVDARHPVQRAMHASVAAACGLAPAQVPFGEDGCGMCAFQLPLGRLAAAFGALASGRLGEGGERIADAMREHPELVAFDGALDTELMRAHEGLVAKIGAEGVLGVGLPDGRGLALKVADGAMRALDPAGIGVVREVLGLTVSGDAIDALAQPVLKNSRGLAVGAGRAVG